MGTLDRPDVQHYTYRVTWSQEDQEFVATAAEFPSLSWLAGSQIEALKGLADLLASVIADLEAQGEPIPQPFAERSYSGKFNVRVGECLHRTLVIDAAEQGVSLNQYVVQKLAS
jgi:predicted HicB family RNase H-like nuclease